MGANNIRSRSDNILTIFDLIANQEKPFLLIEVKQSETSPSKSLIKFQKMLNVPAVQLVDKTDICKILSNGDQKLMVISADHWLSLLP